MRQITLSIADHKFKAFLKLIKSLDYVKLEEVDAQALEEFQNRLDQVKKIQEGKLPKKSIKEFLGEL